MKIKVKVIPKAKNNNIEVLAENYFKIKVTSPPEKGKANNMVIKLLSEYFRISKSKIMLIQGEKSREKIFEIKK